MRWYDAHTLRTNQKAYGIPIICKSTVQITFTSVFSYFKRWCMAVQRVPNLPSDIWLCICYGIPMPLIDWYSCEVTPSSFTCNILWATHLLILQRLRAFYAMIEYHSFRRRSYVFNRLCPSILTHVFCSSRKFLIRQFEVEHPNNRYAIKVAWNWFQIVIGLQLQVKRFPLVWIQFREFVLKYVGFFLCQCKFFNPHAHVFCFVLFCFVWDSFCAVKNGKKTNKYTCG